MGFLRAGYGLDKVYHIRYNHSFRQTYPENKFNLCGFVAFILMQDLSVNERFGICTENKHTIFLGNNTEKDFSR